VPLELDRAGGNLTLDFARGSGTARVCERVLFSPVLVAWTPVEAGAAVIEVDVGDTTLDTLLGVTRPLAIPNYCANWLACNDDAEGLGAGSRLRLPVEAGATYVFSVGLSSPAPDGAQAELRIGFER
jgi:hypothetical protein